MQTALEAQALIKTYTSGGRTVNAVDDISFGLANGEFLALVGPSGSGKTTLLAILAGLLTPDSGTVSIAGEVLSQMSERRRASFRRQRIGFAFQANNLVPYLSALENVELMLRLNGKRDRDGRRRARELLTRLGLEDRLNALPRQLSGGQQQRVAIARSLIHKPALVLADEPTASLDTERAFQVVETLADLVHEEGRAAIMVTHDLRMIKVCDRVVQLMDGKITQVLETQEDLACLANPADCTKIPMNVFGAGQEMAAAE